MITPIVFGTGPRDAKIAIVGEAPGYNEVHVRKPFVGIAGELLTKLLHGAGIPRSEVYITNVVKQRPGKDDNDISSWFKADRGKVWVSEDYIEYQQMLKKELEQLPNLTVCIPLGNTALYALTGLTSIGKRRGSILASTLIPGLKVIPTIHPSAALREYIFTYYIRYDLKRALDESVTKDIQLPEREITVQPSFNEVNMFLDDVEALQETDQELVIGGHDIEVMNEEVSCLSFSIGGSKAISIPFIYNGTNYFTPNQEVFIVKRIARIMANPSIKKVGQNFIFDMSFELRKYQIITRNYECTMIAQGILYPDFPKGLDFIASIYTREPYYKDEGKKWFKMEGTFRNFWIYNAKDSIICSEAFPEMKRRLIAQGNLETYERQKKLIDPLMYMQYRGMKVDTEAKKKHSEEAGVKIIDKLRELSSLMHIDTCLKINKDPETYAIINKEDGNCFEMNKNEMTKYVKTHEVMNAGSPSQLSKLFYTTLGYKPYFNKGAVTTNDDALKRLVRKNVKEAIVIRDIRKIAKLKGTYYDMTLSEDGRLRSAMNPIGTVSGRLASSEDIFGEGGNVQNLPKVFQKFILADDNMIMYICDLSQAENRTTANIAPEPIMIKAFADKIDIHCLTASMISGIDANIIKQQDKDGVKCPLGTGEYTWRFWGKKCKLRTCEVLTYSGWIPIEQAYLLDADIAQWSAIDSTIEFVKPTRWIAENYSGEIYVIENQRIFQEATPEHKMPLLYINRDRRYIVDKPISDYPNSGHHFAPLSGVYTGGTITLDKRIIQLIVAFQADGSWNGNSMTIKVSKDRKIKRLKTIIETLIHSHKDGTFYIFSRSPEVAFIKMLLGKEKLFGKWLLELSQESLLDFLNELPYWDGYKDTYFTTVKQNAEWVQVVAHLCNKAALIHEQDNSKTSAYGNKIVYRVAIRESSMPTSHAINKHSYRVVDEPIFCPTVASGYFLCRENGIVSVTGNCNHSLNYDLGYKSFALRFEMPEPQAKQLVERFHRVYPGIRQYHAWVRQQLAEGGTLTNCYGRKRIFLDRWGDTLFKEAYSWIPQSSIADKINQEGIIYVYYNQRMFKHVEILNQVHDSLVIQIPLSAGLEYHAQVLMWITNSLQTPMTWHGTSFVIPLEFSMCGYNMGTSETVEIKSEETTRRLAGKLHELYSKLRATESVSSVDRDFNDSSLFKEEDLFDVGS